MATGGVQRRKDGFRARVYAGLDPITKKPIQLYGPTRGSETDAAKDIAGLLRTAEAGRHPDRSATVDYLFERWLAVADLELSTRVTNEGYIARTLSPTIGSYALRKLQDRVDILDRLYGHLRRCSKLCDGKPDLMDHRTSRPHECQPLGKDGKPKAKPRACQPHVCTPMPPATIRRVNAILSAACGYAMTWGWIDRNPAALVHLPKQKKKRARPQTAEQVATLINEAFDSNPEFGVVLWLAATTGARRAELVALRWRDVDLTLGLLLLDENYVVRNGQKKIKGTKTDDPRPLSIDALTIAFLTDLKAAKQDALAQVGLELSPDAFVFSPEPDGSKPWNPDTFTKRYERLAQRLGIEEPLKNLRHFNATQLLAGGVDLRTTAGRLGHADGGVTTLRFYADFIRPADQRAAEMVAQDLDRLRESVRKEKVTSRVTFAPKTPMSKLDPVVAALKSTIENGELKPGDRLPAVKDIAAAHRVSYGTAQLAVAELKTAGLVTVERGRRATVR